MSENEKIEINVDNIDDYYNKVNSFIDEYFDWNVRPSSLKKYLKKGSIGMDKFIKRNKLENIKNIEKVIIDVVEDRHAMEKDGVLTFESYNSDINTDIDKTPILFDNILVNNVNKPTVEYEKVIADVYRTSLAYVTKRDMQLHEYIVEKENSTCSVIIYSKEDLDIIKENLIEYTYSYLKNKSIDILSLDMNINLKDLISKDAIVNKFEDENYVIDRIKEILNTHEYKYKGTYSGFIIFEK